VFLRDILRWASAESIALADLLEGTFSFHLYASEPLANDQATAFNRGTDVLWCDGIAG
jgi:hypothetical protein